MTGFRLPIPASFQLRSLGSFALLTITAILVQLVFRLDAEAQALAGTAAGDLAALKTHGFALLLGVVVMLDLAWFSALLRAQAEDARMRPAPAVRRRR
jgi:hypothetical protein